LFSYKIVFETNTDAGFPVSFALENKCFFPGHQVYTRQTPIRQINHDLSPALPGGCGHVFHLQRIIQVPVDTFSKACCRTGQSVFLQMWH
jgi:hypothetical protein